jgi:large subunit ribosomal protein L4
VPKAKLFDMSGKSLGDVELSESVFGAEPNGPAMHAVATAQLANKRQGTQSTLTRAEVAGGGRKPWRQKGTGRARHGSTRSPQWTHGGVAFAPKPRSYRVSINKKLRRAAMRSALSVKAGKEQIVVIRGLEMAEIKTKAFADFMAKIAVAGKALVVTPELNVNVYKSARNIEGVNVTFADVLNVYDVLNGGTVILDEQALKNIEEGYGQ